MGALRVASQHTRQYAWLVLNNETHVWRELCMCKEVFPGSRIALRLYAGLFVWDFKRDEREKKWNWHW